MAQIQTSAAPVAANNRASFPFGSPWDDARSNALDVSFLNDGPAGSHGFLKVKDGHFVEGDTGKRIRFLGTNIALNGCFPAHEDAEKVAGHLAKFGLNLVRLTLQEATWAGGDYTLWDETRKGHRHIDPRKLDKMDYLVAQLEKHGIYIDMGLHSGRKFLPDDGFPDSVQTLAAADKRVDEFDRQMIAVNKEYARDLLTHVNPYTKRAYADDPGLLDVEINNENALMSYPPGALAGSGLAGLPQPYLGELQTLWNRWLRTKYTTTAKLALAWKSPEATSGPNLFPWTSDPARWTLEVQAGAQANLQQDGDALRASVTQTDSTDWHVQLYRKGLALLQNGRSYTLRFEARAEPNRNVGIGANLDRPNYDSLGLSGSAQMTGAWQTFTYNFVAANADPGHNRLPDLILGAQKGTVWLRSVVLKEGTGAYALPPAQTLEAGSVLVEPSGTKQPRADWLAFLADTEAAYAKEMRAYLRQALKVKSLLRCSQAAFGGVFGTYRENESDFVDNHAYWDYHDNFPDPIFNKPMLPTLGVSDPITAQAFGRVAGKPYTLSEINQCFPNEYRAECLPAYAIIGAIQDWDALILFTHTDYGASGAKFGSLDRASTTFDTDKDPALWGFLPAAALMFRGNAMPAAVGAKTLVLPPQYPAARVARGDGLTELWEPTGARAADALTQHLAVQIGGPNAAKADAAKAADSPALMRVFDRGAQTAHYVADAPGAKVISGCVGGKTVGFTGGSVTFTSLTNNFGTFTLTALDQKPVAHSARLLVTLVTHTQNTGQTWNKERTILTNPGRGPMLVDAASASVNLQTAGKRQVHALDGTGQPMGSALAATYQNGTLAFAIAPTHHTVWFLIEAIP